MIGLLVVTVTTPGCFINDLRAKNSLNQGVRDYNKGKFEDAEKKFAFALELDPDMPNAGMFYARSVNEQFTQSLDEKNGLKALEAWDGLIKASGNDHEAVDTAYAFKADIYDQLSRAVEEKKEFYKEKNREMLLARAELSGASQKTKADVYYTIGVGYWDECYKMSGGYVARKQPIPQDVMDKMKPRIQKAHEYLAKTLSVDPQYADAFFYEKLVYLEEIKVEPNPASQKLLQAKAKEMEDKYLQVQKQKQSSGSGG
jgi:tetratricopeptide (TPR) repeat protein